MKFSLAKEEKFLVVLLLGAIAFYIRSINYGFIWDDINYIINNPLLDDPQGLIKIWTSKSAPDFWPVTYSVLWGIKYIFGNSNQIFHGFNLILFITSAFLIYKILEKFNYKHRLLVTAIYAFHPINVELVAWAFQTKSNLAIVFGLISTLSWINFLNTKKTNHYFCSILFLLLSFLSKISLVFLPIIFILMSLNLENKIDFKTLVKKITPILAITFVIGVINILWGDVNAYKTPESETILDSSFLFRLILVGKTFWFYFFQILFPKDFMFVYPRFEIAKDTLLSFIPFLSLVVCALLSLYGFFKNHLKTISSLFLASILLLFPVLGLLEIYYMRFSYVADHWVGIAALPIIILLIELIGLLNQKIFKSSTRIYYYISAGIILVYLAVLSNQHLIDFEDEKTLLLSSVEKNDNSLLLHNLLGQKFKDEGKLDSAIEHFSKAAAINPTASTYFSLARIYEAQNKPELVVANYQKSLELNPYVPLTYINFGVYFIRHNNVDEGVRILNLAIDRKVESPEVYYNLSVVYQKSDKPKAIEYLKKAINLDPQNSVFNKKLVDLSK